MRFVEQNGVQPVIAGRSLRLTREGGAGSAGESAVIRRGQTALACEETVELFELRASERRIEVGQPIVEADFIMHEGPFVWQLRRGRNVLGPVAQFFVVGEDSA